MTGESSFVQPGGQIRMKSVALSLANPGRPGRNPIAQRCSPGTCVGMRDGGPFEREVAVAVSSNRQRRRGYRYDLAL
jgi:hypothetical protein